MNNEYLPHIYYLMVLQVGAYTKNHITNDLAVSLIKFDIVYSLMDEVRELFICIFSIIRYRIRLRLLRNFIMHWFSKSL